MNQETNNQKKLPQKITITRNHEGKLSKVEGLRRDQILIKKNDGTYCILIKRIKEIFKKDLKEFSTIVNITPSQSVIKNVKRALQPISANSNVIPNKINNKDCNVVRNGIKCVKSTLIETDNGLKVSVEGLAGNNFTEEQIKTIKLRIIDQWMNGQRNLYPELFKPMKLYLAVPFSKEN